MLKILFSKIRDITGIPLDSLKDFKMYFYVWRLTGRRPSYINKNPHKKHYMVTFKTWRHARYSVVSDPGDHDHIHVFSHFYNILDEEGAVRHRNRVRNQLGREVPSTWKEAVLYCAQACSL